MEKIKIYAPVDGEIGLIENLKDGVFSEKMLGDGFYIRAKKEKELFKSPVDSGKLSLITETSHAFFFEVANNISILMHIGLDTVKLNGKPFKVKTKINENVNIKSDIVEVDISEINNSGLDHVCPITIDSGNLEFNFNLLAKDKNIKQGDLIGEFVHLQNKVEKQEKNAVQDIKEYFLADSAMAKEANKINEYVGTINNYSEVYNCMTRLRFKIKNKDLVNIEKISKLKSTKGIVWNGNELQVIIGSEVYKMKEEIILDNEKRLGQFSLKSTKHLTPFRRLLQMFGGIMAQIIPVFIGFGVIQAIVGILEWAEVMPKFQTTISGLEAIINAKGIDILWVVLFAIAKTSTMFLGIMIAVAATKYFELRMPIGVGLGIVICSPLLFASGGLMGMGGEWVLFSMGSVDSDISDPALSMILSNVLNIRVTSGGLKIFVVIFAIFFAKKLDDWLGKKINPLFELITRPFLVFFIVSITTFFIFMPIWNFIESIVGLLMHYIGKIPLGIGIGVFAAAWQLAVVFGLHIALGMVSLTQTLASASAGQGGFAIFGAGSSISVYAQLGALIAVSIMTKNALLRKQTLGMIPLGFIGITEPILYGVNLPKKRPLIAGVLAAFVAGSFAGAIGVTARITTGIGFFEIIGYFQDTIYDMDGSIAIATGQLSKTSNGLYYILSCVMSLGLGILFGMLMYKERVTETKAVGKRNNLIQKYIITLFTKDKKTFDKNSLNQNFTNLKNLVSSEETKAIKDLEKDIQKEIKIKTKLENINEKESKILNSLKSKGKDLVLKNKIDSAKNILNKINSINFEDKKNIYIQQLKEIDNSTKIESINKILNGKISSVRNEIKTINEICNLNLPIDLVENDYWNALNEMKILYGLDEIKDTFNFEKEILNIKSEIKESKKQKQVA